MTPEELKAQYERLNTDLQGFIAKANDEIKTFGNAYTDTKTSIQNIQKQVDAIDLQLKERAALPSSQKSFGDELKENESLSRLIRDGRGVATVSIKGGISALERKTTISSTAISTSGNDAATSGVLMFDRTPGIVPAARRKLFIRDLMTSIPTSMSSIDYVKVENDVADASPQVEASAKYENALSFTTATAAVRTVATWIPATKQILDDFSGLQGFIETSLRFAVRKEEEDQILAGDNTGQNLNGLITQATAFSTSLLVASDGWEYVDIIGRAIQQIETASESMPGFVALHPSIWWGIRLQKTSTGEYIYGNPAQGDGQFNLFGLTPIRTLAVSTTQFLVGSAAPTDAVIRDREELNVQISTEHSDYFTKNMIAIRAEERLALVVFRPACYITGTFTQSPA